MRQRQYRPATEASFDFGDPLFVGGISGHAGTRHRDGAGTEIDAAINAPATGQGPRGSTPPDDESSRMLDPVPTRKRFPTKPSGGNGEREERSPDRVESSPRATRSSDQPTRV